jgi:methylated-DNA-[protein]-cysteine S-methyltransferase
MNRSHYLVADSRFGDFGLVWEKISGEPKLLRLLLPRPEEEMAAIILDLYPTARNSSLPLMDNLAVDVSDFLRGRPVDFDLELLAFYRCSKFQTRTLKAEAAIPRGWVSTYGRIAAQVGNPAAGRAVGRALATNPFPIFIPCHRAVRSSGELGGFQGGLHMKKALLEMEGVQFNISGKVNFQQVYY